MSREIFCNGDNPSKLNVGGLLLGSAVYNSGMERLFSDLPELLRDLRKRSGETLEEVAKGSGLSFRSVWGYEAGETKPPVHKLAAVLAHFGITTFADLQRAHDAMRGIPARQGEAPPPGVDKDEIIEILLGNIRALKRSPASQGGREDA